MKKENKFYIVQNIISSCLIECIWKYNLDIGIAVYWHVCTRLNTYLEIKRYTELINLQVVYCYCKYIKKIILDLLNGEVIWIFI